MPVSRSVTVPPGEIRMTGVVHGIYPGTGRACEPPGIPLPVSSILLRSRPFPLYRIPGLHHPVPAGIPLPAVSEFPGNTDEAGGTDDNDAGGKVSGPVGRVRENGGLAGERGGDREDPRGGDGHDQDREDRLHRPAMA